MLLIIGQKLWLLSVDNYFATFAAIDLSFGADPLHNRHFRQGHPLQEGGYHGLAP